MNKYLIPKKHSKFIWRWVAYIIAVSLFLFFVSSLQAAEVTLAWDANSEDDLASYDIYISQGSPGPPYEHISTYLLDDIDRDSPKCVITGLEDGIAYYFVVTASDAEENESGFSEEVCVLNGVECTDLEFIKNFVTRFYQQCLDRNPDPLGLEGWSNALFYHDLTGADVARGFIYSPEFIEKNTTNEEYLTILYKAFFNRNPDPAGFNGWLAVLNDGTDRGYVLDGFIYSIEFYELCEDYGIIPN